jgi:hypothetical protein
MFVVMASSVEFGEMVERDVRLWAGQAVTWVRARVRRAAREGRTPRGRMVDRASIGRWATDIFLISAGSLQRFFFAQVSAALRLSTKS